MFLDGAQLVVDYECERALPGWVPRRLGEWKCGCLLVTLICAVLLVSVLLYSSRWWIGWEERVRSAEIWGEREGLQKTHVCCLYTIVPPPPSE